VQQIIISVSQEPVISIFRVNGCNVLYILKMKAAGSLETLVRICKAEHHNSPEDLQVSSVSCKRLFLL
jgi:hypothetical protein